jgi:hypothetical protein
VIVFSFTILYCGVTLFCQLVNNVTFGIVSIIPVGLFISHSAVYLGQISAVILYLLIGLTFDAMFPFMPFGFSSAFCLLFHCLQKLILNTTDQPAPTHRVLFEQISGVSYVVCLFIFRTAAFSPYQFLQTLASSQIFTMIMSRTMSAWQRDVVIACNNYTKYRYSRFT